MSETLVPADQISIFWHDLDQRSFHVCLPVSLAIILFDIVQYWTATAAE
jgi:hypothetical protein